MLGMSVPKPFLKAMNMLTMAIEESDIIFYVTFSHLELNTTNICLLELDKNKVPGRGKLNNASHLWPLTHRNTHTKTCTMYTLK